MPTLNVKKECLFGALGQDYTDAEFEELCFSFGLELDEVIQENNKVVYKIDIPANRYDLLCLEGLTSALLVFQNKISIPLYTKSTADGSSVSSDVQINVLPETNSVRPYIVGAVLRDVTLTQDRYESLIDLQEKLHQNICRKRTLVAIGTHDLDTVKPPFYYEARSPANISFRPLNQEKEYTAKELIDIYSDHAQMKQYIGIIQESAKYPIVRDSNGTVLSWPPIINSYHSRITLQTKNILIECTATDLNKAVIVLDTLVCAFSHYCKEIYTVQCCEVIYNSVHLPPALSSSRHIYPELRYRKDHISVKKVNKYLGTFCSAEEMASLLNRMCLKAVISTDTKGDIVIEVPPFRHDILHCCDIIEDIAIAYGYNNIVKTLPFTTASFGSQYPLNKLSEQLRMHIAFAGFSEALSFSLCSRDDISNKLKISNGIESAVHIGNPKTAEFQVGRTTLLPGLLKTLSSNKQMPLPLKLFEVSDVILRCSSNSDNYNPLSTNAVARNERHLCAVYYNKVSGFEVVHGLLDRLMQLLNIPMDRQQGYFISPLSGSGTFFEGRCAEIWLREEKIGVIGVLHPDVTTAFDLNLPCSCFEISIHQLIR